MNEVGKKQQNIYIFPLQLYLRLNMIFYLKKFLLNYLRWINILKIIYLFLHISKRYSELTF